MNQARKSIHSIRPMKEADISQVSLIEADAFPQLFPSTSFRKELQREISTVLVAVTNPNLVKDSETPHTTLTQKNSPFTTYRSGNTGWKPGMEFLSGFIFLWNMTTDEPHVMSIGTRRSCRRKGIGELLLHSALTKSICRGAKSLTLEVRVSNTAAISLYQKYGMCSRGLRKSYYTDNHEDGKIMTVDNIQSMDYKNLLNDKWVRLEKRLKTDFYFF